MRTFDWDEIPASVRVKLQADIDRGFDFNGGFFAIHGPDVFNPVYEAIKLTDAFCGEWEFQYDRSIYAYDQAPDKPVSFGSGHGFHKVPAPYRPKEPVQINFRGRKLKTIPRLAALMTSRNPDVLILSDAAYQIISKVVQIPKNRYMSAVAYYRDQKIDETYHIFDPPILVDVFDYEKSIVKWKWSVRTRQWLASPRLYGIAFKKDADFHLGRDESGTQIFISKNLLYTLYKCAKGLEGEYIDPHLEYLGHYYQPKSLA